MGIGEPETSGLDLSRVQAWLQEHMVGVRLVYLESTTSTNDMAWTILESGNDEGVVVLAEEQVSGRGRMGKKWQSLRGAGVWCSFGWVEREEEEPTALFGLIGGIAGADAIRGVTGIPVLLKWPNDLMIEGRKVGGILVESRRLAWGPLAYVLGIGINCFQRGDEFGEDFRKRTISLKLCGAQSLDRTTLVTAMLNQLFCWIRRPRNWGCGDVRREWIARAFVYDELVSLHHGGRIYRGWITDVDPLGDLVVRLEAGTLRTFPAHATSVVLENQSVRL
ncbi:MAG: biotin--[acetyl-CoA-carboxylase] ligase [Planctomycetota bacterium]